MHDRTAILAAMLALAAAQPALGQKMYKCVDAKGKVYYTQLPPSECLGKGAEELSRQGQVVKRLEGALTPQQEAAREAERRKKQEDEIAAREERRRNQALLNTYSSEGDIEEARSRAIKDNELAVKEIEKRVEGALKRRKAFEAEKEFYAKKPVPAKLQDDIKNNEIELKNQQELLAARKKQVAGINAKYDSDKKRYLELTKGDSGTRAAKQ